jgi:MFS transporter, FHS family, Na+ dependent glucose transporter 1
MVFPSTAQGMNHSIPVENTSGVSRPQMITWAYFASFVALGFANASLGPTLPGLAENTGTHLNQISILFAARALGYLLGAFQGGRIFDRTPGHPVMAVTVFAMAGLMLLIPLIPMLWVLASILLLLGVSEGMLDVGANTLLVWVHRHRVGPFMNALHFFFGVGAFFTPIIVAQAMLITGTLKWSYWSLGLLMIPVACWLLLLPSPKRKTASGAPTGQISNPVLVGLIALFYFLYAGAESSFGGWLFTYALKTDLLAPTAAAYLTSGFWITFTLGRLASIPIARRFRPRTILFTDLSGALISLLIILLQPRSITALWVGTLGTGLFLASIFPTVLALAERRVTITGRVTSSFMVGAGAGAMLLPWLIGFLFESLGPQTLLYALLLDLLLATAVFAILIWHAPKAVMQE